MRCPHQHQGRRHLQRQRRRRPRQSLRQNDAVRERKPQSYDSTVKRRTRNKKAPAGPLKKVGLARALSKLGYCSRSRAAELIAAGRVKWNGAVRRDPETPVHLGKNRIEIGGRALARSSKIYL